MFTTRPEILGTFGVVASTHWLASAAGMAVLEKGGNAFDAAVAAGFVLQVVEPHLNGPGGEVPLIIRDARRDRVEVICGQGVAPAAATIGRYRNLGFDLVPGTGLLAAVVPGAFDAWMLLLRDHGTLKLRDVLEHAIFYAENGYPLVPRICDTIASVRDLFADEWVSSAEIYLPRGDVPEPGSLFRNRDLAATWRRLLEEAETAGRGRTTQIEAARRIWAEGFVAEAIDHYCGTAEIMDTSGRRHRGLLTGEDMAGWRASVEAPATYDYEGYTLCKAGPWSQGPMFLQQLALLRHFEIGRMDPLGPDFVHTVVECAKLAFADRERFYGDPRFVEVPLDTLLSPAYNAERASLVGPTASRAFRPGKVPGHGGTMDLALQPRQGPARFSALAVGEPTLGRGMAGAIESRAAPTGDTCHLDVVDRHGNMVSATPSGGWLQSSPVIPGLGFCLTNRAQMFWLEEGSASSLQPGKRPRTTLTPSFALRDGEPYMAFGTPGGDQQDQWSLIFFLRHAQHGLNLQEAIDAPMFHTGHAPSSFWPRLAEPASLALEARFPAATIEELRWRGHEVRVARKWSLGRISAAARRGELLVAAANPRGMQGYAVGR